MIAIKLENIPIKEIYPRKDQPRKSFDKNTLDELATSIKKYGILQPIIVSKAEDGYAIIAGERRYQAAKLANLHNLPCIVKDKSNTREIALIENLQRENLKPIEEAKAIHTFMKESKLSQSDMASILAKSRSYIANRLRLLNLDEFTASQLETRAISEGHAKTLLGIADEKKRQALTQKIINEGLSVRQTEEQVRKSKPYKKSSEDVHIKEAMDKLTDILQTKVSLKGTQAKGTLTIEYYNKDQLNELVEKLFSLE